MIRTLSRDEKAQWLGITIHNVGMRAQPLGRMVQLDDHWRWTLTRFDDGVEHRLILTATDPTAFGVWLHSGHEELLKGKPYRTVRNPGTISTADWARIAKTAQDTTHDGILSIGYYNLPVHQVSRNHKRWVTTKEAAMRLGTTPDVVRDRIRRGHLMARKVRQAGGMFWEVDMSNGSVQAEMPITEAPVKPLIAPPAPRVTFVEPTPAAVPAPAPTAPANPTIAMVVRLFERLDTATQAETLQRLMEIAYP